MSGYRRGERRPRHGGAICGRLWSGGSRSALQYAGFGLILGDVGDVVEDKQIVAVEFGDSAFMCQLATSNLELLHEISGAGEQHAPSILDQGEPERCRQMAFAAARWAEEQDWRLSPTMRRRPPAPSPALSRPLAQLRS